MPKQKERVNGDADVYSKLKEGVNQSRSFIKLCAEEILQILDDGHEFSGRLISDGSVVTLGDCVEILSRHYANFRQCSVSLSNLALSAKFSAE